METAQLLPGMVEEAQQVIEQTHRAYETALSPAARAHALAVYLAEVEAYEILLAEQLLPKLAGKVNDEQFLMEAIEDSRVLRQAAQKVELPQGAPERADAVEALHDLVGTQIHEIVQKLMPALHGVEIDFHQLAQDWAAHRVRLREQRTAAVNKDPTSEDQA